MKYDIDHQTYEALYARYLNKDRLLQMMDLFGEMKDKTFLDICCGGGRATDEALNRRISVSYMIDEETKMVPDKFICNYQTKILIADVEMALKRMIMEHKKENFIDFSICQQAINYWLNHHRGFLLSKVLKTEGIFVFNTFNEQPSTKPCVKEYEFEGDHYVEISYRIGENKIHHVQIRNGYPPHETMFTWMDDNYIRYCLGDFFNIDVIQNGKTSIYKCIKKEN